MSLLWIRAAWKPGEHECETCGSAMHLTDEHDLFDQNESGRYHAPPDGWGQGTAAQGFDDPGWRCREPECMEPPEAFLNGEYVCHDHLPPDHPWASR